MDNILGQNVSENGLDKSPHIFNLKAKKLATALYMVTDKMADSDPIRTRARTIATEIFSNLSNIGHRGFFGLIADEISGKISEMISLLEIASAVGTVSGMNVVVLTEEYRKLVSHMSGFLLESVKKETSVSEEEILAVKDNVIRDKNYTFKISPLTPTPQFKVLSKNVSEMAKIRQKLTLSRPKVEREDKVERKNKVLSYFSKGREIGIKDVYVNFPGVSEKTIQREINRLVLEGVLRRVGEKRWSRYTLV